MGREPQVWRAEPHEAEVVGGLLVEFRNHLGLDWPSDDAFVAGVERLVEDFGTHNSIAPKDSTTLGIHSPGRPQS